MLPISNSQYQVSIIFYPYQISIVEIQTRVCIAMAIPFMEIGPISPYHLQKWEPCLYQQRKLDPVWHNIVYHPISSENSSFIKCFRKFSIYALDYFKLYFSNKQTQRYILKPFIFFSSFIEKSFLVDFIHSIKYLYSINNF